jgi:orotate phosphoribosyltransferase
LNAEIRVAQALLDAGAIRFSTDHPFRFKSGLLSPIYVDARCLPFHPGAWQIVLNELVDTVFASSHVDLVIAGVAVGGIPHSSVVAYRTSLPHVFVRTTAKDHGTAQRIEGGDVTGRHTLLIEDMITTGGSSLQAVHALREAKALVHDVVAIVGYGFAEAAANFVEAGTSLRCLTNSGVILELAEEAGLLSPDQARTVRQWMADPVTWTSDREREAPR